MIAATAAVHDLVVATRKVRDFEMFRTPTLYPFEKRGGAVGD
jgi:predicted nucleic acid-binding protein